MQPDPAAVNSMFGRIARRYDLANRILSGGMDLRWRARLVAAVGRAHPEGVLDLATGSGDVALALARGLPAKTRIVGMDFCQPMLDQAEAKKRASGGSQPGNLSFVCGDALNIAVPDASYDAVTIAFGLRNMADRGRCLREIRRILRPGGRLFILEFSRPSRWFRPIYNLYLLHISPWLAGALTGHREAYRYLGESIGRFPDREALSAEIASAGFDAIFASPMTFGIVALHEARRPPGDALP